MKEVFISFAVFVFCVSLTLFSQFNSPKVVNAAESETQSVQRPPVAKSSNVSNINLFELDPSDPNPILFAMARRNTFRQQFKDYRKWSNYCRHRKWGRR